MMIPYRLLAISSTLLLGALLAGAPGAPPATSAPAQAHAAAAAPPAAPASAPAAVAAPAAPSPPPSGAAAAPAGQAGQAPQGGHEGQPRRVAIPSPEGRLYPYTVELPAGWAVLQSKTVPGVFLGPAGVSAPENDASAVYVRVSPVSLADPEAVVANIRKTDAADDSWSAPLLEVRTIGGVRGVLVRMDSGSGEKARSTLVLKMPLGKQTSLDFMASAPRAEFERRLPDYQRVILSVLPAQ
jgi:hypothetical protein